MGTALGEATEPATRVPGLCTQAPTGRGSAQSGWPSGCLWPGDGPGLCPEGDRVRLGTQDGHWVSGSPLKSGSGLVVREGSPRALEQNHQNGVLSVPQQAGPGAGLSLITETPGLLWGRDPPRCPRCRHSPQTPGAAGLTVRLGGHWLSMCGRQAGGQELQEGAWHSPGLGGGWGRTVCQEQGHSNSQTALTMLACPQRGRVGGEPVLRVPARGHASRRSGG